MALDIIRLLIDFGLVVLIWMIQRIVYPSFLYYNTQDLAAWHKEYTSRFSAIAVPLMFGQLGISIYQLIISTNLHTVASVAIIILVWIATFFQFVPIHSDISKERANEKILKALVNKNWLRTFLWTLLFIMNCIIVFQKQLVL
jgi:hypothetical protein